MSPKIVDKAVRKKEIIVAAMRIVAKKGIKNVRIDEIAAEAGIGKGTLYEYFTSKEDIFGETMVEFMQQIETAMARKMFRASTPEEKLRALTDAWVEAAENEGGEVLELLIDVWAEGLRRSNPEMIAAFDLKRIYEDFRDLISGIIQDGINSGVFRAVDPLKSAAVFIGVTDGLVMQWLMDKQNFNLRQHAEILLNIFLQGISQK